MRDNWELRTIKYKKKCVWNEKNHDSSRVRNIQIMKISEKIFSCKITFSTFCFFGEWRWNESIELVSKTHFTRAHRRPPHYASVNCSIVARLECRKRKLKTENNESSQDPVYFHCKYECWWQKRRLKSKKEREDCTDRIFDFPIAHPSLSTVNSELIAIGVWKTRFCRILDFVSGFAFESVL